MAVKSWKAKSTVTISNDGNRRDPTIVYDTSQYPYGNVPGYGPPYDFTPLNNQPRGWDVAQNKPQGDFVFVPLAQFDDPDCPYRIADAVEIRVTGRVNMSGGTAYLYYRAPGSTWDKSNNISIPWDQGNLCFTMPVGKNAQGVTGVEYRFNIVSGNPAYTLNLILDGWTTNVPFATLEQFTALCNQVQTLAAAVSNMGGSGGSVSGDLIQKVDQTYAWFQAVKALRAVESS